eukprot:3729438-Pyramimonas_sp.AAC.1
MWMRAFSSTLPAREQLQTQFEVRSPQQSTKAMQSAAAAARLREGARGRRRRKATTTATTTTTRKMQGEITRAS